MDECDECGIEHDYDIRCNDESLNPYVDDYHHYLHGE